MRGKKICTAAKHNWKAKLEGKWVKEAKEHPGSRIWESDFAWQLIYYLEYLYI